MQEPGGYRLVREGLVEVVTRMETPGLGSVAGSRVLEGQVSEDSYVRIAREREVLWSGRVRHLQGGGPALAGQECAIAFEGFEAFQAGDSIEIFRPEPLA